VNRLASPFNFPSGEIIIEEFSSGLQQQVIDLILGIQQNEFHVPITLDDQPDLLSIPSFYQKEKGNFWIARQDEKLVGTIALLSFSDEQAALRKMFVHKDFRGKEYGTAQKLFDALLNWSEERGIEKIYLGTLQHMHRAQSFYRRNHFVEVRKEDLPPLYPIMHVDSLFFELTLLK